MTLLTIISFWSDYLLQGNTCMYMLQAKISPQETQEQGNNSAISLEFSNGVY